MNKKKTSIFRNVPQDKSISYTQFNLNSLGMSKCPSKNLVVTVKALGHSHRHCSVSCMVDYCTAISMEGRQYQRIV